MSDSQQPDHCGLAGGCTNGPPLLPFREVWEGSDGERVWLCRECAGIVVLRISREWPVGLWPEGEVPYVDRHYCKVEECADIVVGPSRLCEAHRGYRPPPA